MDTHETKVSLDEIKQDIRQLVKATIEVVTKLDIYVGQHSDLESRVRGLEEKGHRQDGVNADSDKRWGRLLIIVVTSEVLIAAGAFILTHLMSK